MQAKKNTLFISYDGMTDPLGQSQVIPYLTGLSSLYNIYILSCEKKEAFRQNKKVIAQQLQNAGINWVPISYTKKPAVLSTLYDVVKLRAAAKKIHRRHPLSLVHTRPGIPSLVGAWLKKKYGIIFLNDIREFYADSRVDGGMWNVEKPAYKKIYDFFKKQEAEEVRLSDGIVCLTNTAENIIRSWPDYQPGTPVEMIPCSVDLKLFSSETVEEKNKEQWANKLGITANDFVVSYLGSIGGWYLTGEMMRFCKIITETIPAAKFLFIAPHLHEQIRSLGEKYGIPPERIVTIKAKRTEVPALLALCRYSIFFIKPCYSKLSSSPTKHGEIMGMGLPVVTNSGVGDVEEIIDRYNSGVVIQYFSDDEYRAAAEQMLRTHFDRTRIRQGAEEFYSLDKAIEKYKKMYRALLGE